MKISLCSTYFCPWKNWRTDHSQNIYGIYQHVLDLAFHYLWTLSTHITLANENKRPPHCLQRGKMTLVWLFRAAWEETREDVPQLSHLISGESCSCKTTELPKTSLRGWGTHPTWYETCRASPPPHPHLKQQLPLLLPPTLTPYSSWGIFYFFNIWHNFNYHFSCITQVWHPRKKKTYSSYIISTSGLWIKWLPCNLY